MNKTDLVTHIAEKTGLAKKDSTAALEATLDAICETLSKGESLTLTGFGTFSVGMRAARQGKNPKTGAAITIPASKSVKFKPGKALKDGVK